MALKMKDNNSKSLHWDVVEKAIAKEVKWLKETIPESPYSEKNESHGLCKNCIYRRIAILIVSGKIKARDIKSTICLWGKKKISLKISHGEKWHSEIMRLVSGYFKSLNYKITIEPMLHWGRADLGVYKKGEHPLFIEVGTVSLSKLLFNLESMEGSDFLLILDPNHAVEFSILKADYKYWAV
jgi:hypothetical protein